jgi:hypothetical protein
MGGQWDNFCRGCEVVNKQGFAHGITNRILPVGALWGYGSREELAAARCRHFVRSANEFRKLYVETDRGVSEQGRAGKVVAR